MRIVAGTNRNLRQMVTGHAFREDLYHRLAVITLTLPPLRDRRPDIPALAESFLERINRDFAGQEPGYRDKKLSAAAREFVKKHPGPATPGSCTTPCCAPPC